jgi:hypothetical protein
LPDKYTEPSIRVHLMLFKDDWEWLSAYSGSVPKSNVVRDLLRDFRKKIEARVEQQSRGGEQK